MKALERIKGNQFIHSRQIFSSFGVYQNNQKKENSNGIVRSILENRIFGGQHSDYNPYQYH